LEKHIFKKIAGILPIRQMKIVFLLINISKIVRFGLGQTYFFARGQKQAFRDTQVYV